MLRKAGPEALWHTGYITAEPAEVQFQIYGVLYSVNPIHSNRV